MRVELRPEDYGYVKESEVPDQHRMMDMLEGVIESLWETGNTDMLHHCLEELAAELNMDIPEGPMLEEKRLSKMIRQNLERGE